MSRVSRLKPTSMRSPAATKRSNANRNYTASPQFRDGRFVNARARPKSSSSNILRLLWNFYFNKPSDCEPTQPIPVEPVCKKRLEAAPDCLVRLGHSSVLVKINGRYLLTDPVFAKRASPFSFMGPKRFHEPPIALEDLPPLAAVVLSHNHYDHLDRHAVRALADKTERFLTPLGVGDTLVNWGIEAAKVDQFDWWSGTEHCGIHFVATPAQHFSGRTFRDGNQTLWCSWVMTVGDFRLFFSGDSGYFDGFKAIGDRYGPFNLTLMETGAYNHQWAFVHMRPEESLQAHLDLRGEWLLPIHNGTFDLAMHAWYDPFERIERLAAQHNTALTTPKMGEVLSLREPHSGSRWWREAMPRNHATAASKNLATE